MTPRDGRPEPWWGGTASRVAPVVIAFVGLSLLFIGIFLGWSTQCPVYECPPGQNCSTAAVSCQHDLASWAIASIWTGGALLVVGIGVGAMGAILRRRNPLPLP